MGTISSTPSLEVFDVHQERSCPATDMRTTKAMNTNRNQQTIASCEQDNAEPVEKKSAAKA